MPVENGINHIDHAIYEYVHTYESIPFHGLYRGGMGECGGQAKLAMGHIWCAVMGSLRRIREAH